jgi:hypothetical protein
MPPITFVIDPPPGPGAHSANGAGPLPPGVAGCGNADLPMPQRGLPHGAYRSPKNLRTRADLRARTRRNGSENTA